jgi:shikimate kinase
MTIDPDPAQTKRRGSGLALVGYRGTGKSTVGRIVADRLSRAFLDVDLEIETRAGQSISSIFMQAGEDSFRAWEERTLCELTRANPCAVLATGGGCILLPSNRQVLTDFGVVVWLQAEPAELARRLQEDLQAGWQRPSLTPAGTMAEIAEVLAARKALYAEVADAEIDTLGRTPGEVAEQILWLLNP